MTKKTVEQPKEEVKPEVAAAEVKEAPVPEQPKIPSHTDVPIKERPGLYVRGVHYAVNR